MSTQEESIQNSGSKGKYVCSECNYSSKYKHHLTRHNIRKHTGERPFECGKCDYAATQSGSLVVHMKTHTNERPFKCERCDWRGTVDDRITMVPYHIYEHFPFDSDHSLLVSCKRIFLVSSSQACSTNVRRRR